MNLKSLLLSADEKTVRVLRRVLSDLEIDVEHCASTDDAIRMITRHRFEAIIVDGVNVEEAGNVFRSAKAAPANKRALGIVLVESTVGLKGGFEMGAHFVLHKPLAVERAKSSFRAVRALMKRERRQQMRLPVQLPVECFGSSRYKATTVDISEGGMAIQFIGKIPKENSLRFSLDLPGVDEKLEMEGELAWEGKSEHAGVRFKEASDDQLKTIRNWINAQLSESDQDNDPPVKGRVSDLSPAGCYLTTTSPFPRGTRVVLTAKAEDQELRAGGLVLVAHPEYGMGLEFLQTAGAQHDQVERFIQTLRASKDKSPEVQVEPDGLETPAPDGSLTMFQAFEPTAAKVGGGKTPAANDTLVDLFRHKFQVPVESFMQQMREKRQSVEASFHANAR
jgi:c-di-GMP-binding flagellar brake protein YcgR